VPNAVLASVLIVVGYKLAKPVLFKKMWERGWTQFLPFIATILVIVFTDLLKGIFVGLTIGIIVVLVKSFQNSLFLHKDKQGDKEHIKMALAEEVTFLNKATIQRELNEIPENSHLELDIRKTRYLDFDVIEILEDFVIQARNKNIHVHLKSERGNVDNPTSYIEFFKLKKKSD
jgi:MFS superfamily sulfate permease-like transporter